MCVPPLEKRTEMIFQYVRLHMISTSLLILLSNTRGGCNAKIKTQNTQFDISSSLRVGIYVLSFIQILIYIKSPKLFLRNFQTPIQFLEGIKHSIAVPEFLFEMQLQICVTLIVKNSSRRWQNSLNYLFIIIIL